MAKNIEWSLCRSFEGTRLDSVIRVPAPVLRIKRK